MYISDIEIFDFKAFKGETPYELELSRHLNCISGHNGVGKSTILAILSNCGELRKKDGSQINGKAFRGEYSQLIKGDTENDTSGKKCTLRFKDLPKNKDKNNPFVSKLEFRATFQTGRRTKTDFKLIDNKNGLYKSKSEQIKYNRYRLIPVKKPNKRETEKKLNWPVIYLGLTRLFPIGESEHVEESRIPKDILKRLHNDHKKILSSFDEYKDSSHVTITDTSKKMGFGVTTNDYSYLSNSAGQDNLGQILLSVYSFEKLKCNYADYSGGILLIDEIDSTLHPAAQNNLIDFLLKKSIELNLQIVFTSHSQSIIEYLNFKRENPNNRNFIKINYLDNSTGDIRIIDNPTNKYIRNNLHNTYAGILPEQKITIFTEDRIGEWLLKKILEINDFEMMSSIQFNNTSIGWEKLVNLVKNDYQIFKDVIIFLDPDLSKPDNEKKLTTFVAGTMYQDKINIHKGKIFYLEFGDYIENVFWEYLNSLPPDDNFFLNPDISEHNFNARSIKDSGPKTSIYDELGDNDQERIKAWFNSNLPYIDKAFPYWYKTREKEIDDFYNKFCASFYTMLK